MLHMLTHGTPSKHAMLTRQRTQSGMTQYTGARFTAVRRLAVNNAELSSAYIPSLNGGTAAPGSTDHHGGNLDYRPDESGTRTECTYTNTKAGITPRAAACVSLVHVSRGPCVCVCHRHVSLSSYGCVSVWRCATESLSVCVCVWLSV